MTHHKYGARRTEVDGHTFDSRAEANRYCELSLLAQTGAISGLALQPSFQLLPSYKRDGKTVRGITYTADFSYVEGDRTVIEDVKGVETETFRLKWKWVQYLYPEYDWRIVK